MVVVSGSGTIGLKLLEGTVLVIVGSGDGSTIVVLLAVTVVVYGRSTGATFLVVVFGTYAGSKGVELSAGTLVEELVGKILVVFTFNRGSVATILTGNVTGTGNRTGPATTYLIYILSLLTLPSGFCSQQ